jgi:deoxycytidylate deaminase
VNDTGLSKEKLRYRSLHAEMNAILHAHNRDIEGATIYISPFSPCAICAAMIIQSGIKNVIVRITEGSSAWVESQAEALEMFKESGVNYYELPNDTSKANDRL